MILLVRPYFAALCLWLAAWMSATPALAARVSCEDWNTEVFFQRAGVADISRCLKVGAKVNARDEDGSTPLHIAVLLRKTPAVVAALLDVGAYPNARDEDGSTPLHHAAAHSKTPAVLSALLDAGAAPAVKDKKGKTPWDHIGADSPLKGTDAYWRLNDGRFK